MRLLFSSSQSLLSSSATWIVVELSSTMLSASATALGLKLKLPLRVRSFLTCTLLVIAMEARDPERSGVRTLLSR